MGRYQLYNRQHVDELLDTLETHYEREMILAALDALLDDPDTPQVNTFPFRGDQFGTGRMVAELPLGYYLVYQVHPNGIMPSTAPAISLHACRRLEEP